MNIKISVLGLALLGTALYYLNPEPTDKVTREENMVTLEGVFLPETAKAFIEEIKDINKYKGPGERMLFVVDSPGGSVSSGNRMIHTMRKGIPTDTYVPLFAASMGAEAFISGERRYIDPEAQLVFHGSFLGDYALGLHTFKKALSILKDEKTDILVESLRKTGVMSLNDVKDFNRLTTVAYEIGIDTSNPVAFKLALSYYIDAGRDVAIQEMKSRADNISITNEGSVARITKLMNQAGKNVTEDFVRTEILKDFKEDVYMSGQEAFDLGIATHLGAPPEKDYVSQ